MVSPRNELFLPLEAGGQVSGYTMAYEVSKADNPAEVVDHASPRVYRGAHWGRRLPRT